MKTFFALLLIVSQIISCGSIRKTETSSIKQAAVACLVLAPAAPVAATCAVTVTAAQWIVAVVVGGAVVGSVAVAASSSTRNVNVAGYTVQLRPTPVPAPHPPRPQPTSTPCAPCGGPLPAPMYHQVPPSRPHWPCTGSHTHYYRWNQNPQSCQCFPAKIEPPTCH